MLAIALAVWVFWYFAKEKGNEQRVNWMVVLATMVFLLSLPNLLYRMFLSRKRRRLKEIFFELDDSLWDDTSHPSTFQLKNELNEIIRDREREIRELKSYRYTSSD